MIAQRSLTPLQKRIIACRKCPRLVRYLAGIKKVHPAFWCRPVPSFGDPRARILILGLAPGRFGANRTGWMFTGDHSGKFLYRTLFEVGLSHQAEWRIGRKGALIPPLLTKVYITAALRCAPPQNKPAPIELKNCGPYLEEELQLLDRVKVVVALGQIAHQSYLRLQAKRARFQLSQFPFRHGAVYQLPGDSRILIDTYHPSRQNTQTGKLTRAMFRKVFRQAVQLAGSGESARQRWRLSR